MTKITKATTKAAPITLDWFIPSHSPLTGHELSHSSRSQCGEVIPQNITYYEYQKTVPAIKLHFYNSLVTCSKVHCHIQIATIIKPMNITQFHALPVD